MHPSRGRIVEDRRGRRTITIDPRLDRVQRNATLAHEMVHDEYDLIFHPHTPDAIVAKAERIVEGITADRLVPPDELRAFVEQRSELEGVVARHVADEFEVPVDVAHRALLRLASGF